MTRRSAPGQLVIRTAPGTELERIATHRDVRAGASRAAYALDQGGPIDVALRRHTMALQASRAFYSRRGLALGAGHGNVDFDDLEHELGLARTFRVYVDPDAPLHSLVEDLLAIETIESATPAYLCELPFAGPAPAAARIDRARVVIGADHALAIEPGDSALIVALVDSGVDSDHEELAGRLRPGLSSVALHAPTVDELRVISGAHARLQDVSDDQGHGTACAGLIAALGLAMGRGVAGAARLLPVRALCGAIAPGAAHPTAIGLIPDIDSGLKTAVDLGARVINLSFGTPEDELGDDPIPHVEAVRYALAHDCILIAAAGNSGKATRFYPAALPGVIAIGAVDDHRRPAAFSTRGSHVALSAPGVQIATAGIDGYGVVSGTSFAAPLVTGACALLVAHAARFSRPLGPEAARRVLVASVSPFAAGTDATGCGAGILDIPAALAAVESLCRDDGEGEARAA
ncbi:MAG: S8 family serine peptidase [Kofleriaceae bacterium]